jgi:hypothetical protein
MSKELPFFKFNATQWLTGNINYESFHTQGVFIKVCAEYWNRSNEMSYEDIVLRVNDSTTIDYLIEKEYIKVKNKKLFIKFLDEEKIDIDSKRLKLSEAGRKGGLSSVQARLKQGSSIKNKDKEEDKEIEKSIVFIPETKKDILLNKWINYRIEIKKKLSEASINNLKKLLDTKSEECIEFVINESISNGWQGLFWDNYKEKPKVYKSVDDLYAENVMRQMEENQRRNDTSRRT